MGNSSTTMERKSLGKWSSLSRFGNRTWISICLRIGSMVSLSSWVHQGTGGTVSCHGRSPEFGHSDGRSLRLA